MYRMHAVKESINFLEANLEHIELGATHKWHTHEIVCHETFSPTLESGMAYQFDYSRCSDKGKIERLFIGPGFEKKATYQMFYRGGRSADRESLLPMLCRSTSD